MKLAAVIIAGGRSERMGGAEKLFLTIGGRTILERLIAVLNPQVDRIAINANADPARFAAYGLPVVPDTKKDLATPLAGLHAALHWAHRQGHELLLTVPSDTPFLPADLVKKLSSRDQTAAMAASMGHVHYLTALWSASLLPSLDQAVAAKLSFRVQDWARSVNAVAVEWQAADYDPFMNINTPEDLAEAERLAAEFDL